MFIFGAAISFEAQSSMDIRQLAKVQECIGESLVDIRQLANVQGVFWRKFSGRSPMAKLQTAKFLLAKFRLPFNTR